MVDGSGVESGRRREKCSMHDQRKKKKEGKMVRRKIVWGERELKKRL